MNHKHAPGRSGVSSLVTAVAAAACLAAAVLGGCTRPEAQTSPPTPETVKARIRSNPYMSDAAKAAALRVGEQQQGRAVPAATAAKQP